MGAETQNVQISILRGTTTNQFGDEIDSNVPLISDLPATLIETGKNTQDPSTPTPRTIRQISCWVPLWAGVRTTDRILDQDTGDIFMVISVTKPPTIIGAPVDEVLQLKRVSANSDG
jgi:hypothetical protein